MAKKNSNKSSFKVPKSRFTGMPILTVGQLRRLIAKLHDEEQVLIWSDSDETYLNVSVVHLPDEDTHAALTLYPGKRFSPIQF